MARKAKATKQKTVVEGVFLRPGSKNYQISYTNEFGVQKRKTARTDNKAVAEAFYLRTRKEVLARRHPVAAILLGEITGKQVTLNKFLEDTYYPSISDTTSEDIRKYALKSFSEKYGHILIKDIGLPQLLEYRDSHKTVKQRVYDGSKLKKNEILSKDGRHILTTVNASNGTKNRHRAWIMKALSYAVSNNVYPKDKLTLILADDNYKKLPEVEKLERAFSADNLHKILNAADTEKYMYLYQLIWFAIVTGFRKGRIFSLKWSEINEDENEIQIAPKNPGSASNHVIPISVPIKVILDVRKKDKKPECPYVFYNPNTGTKWTGMNKSWWHVLEIAGLRTRTDKQSLIHFEKMNEKRIKDGLEPLPFVKVDGPGMDAVFHSLRHSFGSYLEHFRIPITICMRLLGHSNINTTERYLKSIAGVQKYKTELNQLSVLVDHKPVPNPDFMDDLEGYDDVIDMDTDDEAAGAFDTPPLPK